MSYFVSMKDMATGEVVKFAMECQWEKGDEYFWSEGNYGCDCNRELEFRRAKGEEPDLDSVVCNLGANRFVVLSIVSESGEVLFHDAF